MQVKGQQYERNNTAELYVICYITAKDLIQQLLQVDPNKRITAAEALCHPWIAYEGNEMNESNTCMDRDIIINVRRGFSASRQSLKPSS